MFFFLTDDVFAPIKKSLCIQSFWKRSRSLEPELKGAEQLRALASKSVVRVKNV